MMGYINVRKAPDSDIWGKKHTVWVLSRSDYMRSQYEAIEVYYEKPSLSVLKDFIGLREEHLSYQYVSDKAQVLKDSGSVSVVNCFFELEEKDVRAI